MCTASLPIIFLQPVGSCPCFFHRYLPLSSRPFTNHVRDSRCYLDCPHPALAKGSCYMLKSSAISLPDLGPLPTTMGFRAHGEDEACFVSSSIFVFGTEARPKYTAIIKATIAATAMPTTAPVDSPMAPIDSPRGCVGCGVGPLVLEGWFPRDNNAWNIKFAQKDFACPTLTCSTTTLREPPFEVESADGGTTKLMAHM